MSTEASISTSETNFATAADTNKNTSKMTSTEATVATADTAATIATGITSTNEKARQASASSNNKRNSRKSNSISSSASATTTANSSRTTITSSTYPHEIAVFDLETTIATKANPLEILEFGCIIVHAAGWSEISRYTTLIKPKQKISNQSTRIHGITNQDVEVAPSFKDVAANIYSCLNNRIWAGHNLKSFDAPHIKRAFEALNLEPPICCGIIDTLPYLRQILKGRVENFKMATLGLYFRLGVEDHRALKDCEMTIGVMQRAALMLAMERDFPDLCSFDAIESRVDVESSAIIEITEDLQKLSVTSSSSEITSISTSHVHPQTPKSTQKPAAIPNGVRRQTELVILSPSASSNVNSEPTSRINSTPSSPRSSVTTTTSSSHTTIDSNSKSHIELLTWSMTTKSPLKVTYNGGSQPGTERTIVAVSWDSDENQRFFMAQSPPSQKPYKYAIQKIGQIMKAEEESTRLSDQTLSTL